MKRYLAPGALILTLAACGGNPSPAGPSAMPAATAPAGATMAAAATITPEDMRERIAFLASDALKGRDTPSPGLDTAAAYIAREFASFGM
jgi:hypothetical protein